MDTRDDLLFDLFWCVKSGDGFAPELWDYEELGSFPTLEEARGAAMSYARDATADLSDEELRDLVVSRRDELLCDLFVMEEKDDGNTLAHLVKGVKDIPQPMRVIRIFRSMEGHKRVVRR